MTPPRSLILCVICNRGWRLVKIGFYVYFNVRWGRRRAHHFVIAAMRSNACSTLKDRNVRDYTTCCEPFRKCLNIACVLSCSRSIIKNTINTHGKLKVSESLFFVKLMLFDASSGSLTLESKKCSALPSATGPQTSGSVETPTPPALAIPRAASVHYHGQQFGNLATHD